MADVIEQAAEPTRRSRVGLAVGLAAVLALGALVVVPQRAGDDEAGPRPAPNVTVAPSPSPSPRIPILADLDGPRRTAPTGLHVFAKRGGQLVRLDVDSGEVVPIEGVGVLTRFHVYVQPWGDGAAIVKIAQTDGYDNSPATVFLLRPGAERATRIGTAHVLLRGARQGDMVFVTEKSFEEGGTAVTYDARGRRRATRRVPPRSNVVADSPAGLVRYESATPDGQHFELHVGPRSRSFVDRYLLAATSRFLVSAELKCALRCNVMLTDLTTGDEKAYGSLGDGMASEVSIAPGDRHALLRMYIIGADDTQQGENIYHLDVASRAISDVAGAMSVGPLHRVEWTGDGRAAFLQSNQRWAYWTVDGGLELLERKAGLEVLGIA